MKYKSQFSVGEVHVTPAAFSAIRASEQNTMFFLVRHCMFRDWGCVSEEDAKMNEAAIESGARILSAYILDNGTKIWIITEAADENGERAATTVLLPEEY